MKRSLLVSCICLFLYPYILLSKPKPTILTTNTILKEVVKQLVGDEFKVDCLLDEGADPHSFEPVTSDVKKIEESEVIVVNGLHLEGWLEKMLKQEKKCPIIVATSTIKPIKTNPEFDSPDPHAWMDPLLMKEYVKYISEQISICFPEKKIKIQGFEQEYLLKLDTLHQFISEEINKIPIEKRVLITTHDAFRYFGKRYGIQVESAIGTSTDAEVMVDDLNQLSDLVKKRKIPAVFVESTLNPKFFDQFVQDHQIRLGGKLYADALGLPLTGAETYIGMMRHNTKTIVEALSSAGLSPKPTFLDLPIKLVVVLCSVFGLAFWFLANNVHKKANRVSEWDSYKIVVSDVSCSYNGKTVLSHINLELESGKLYGLLGPNGAGKSTLFKCILGLVKPDSGSVLINNLRIDDVRDKIAYIPQKEDIDWTFPATVLDIVLTGRIPHKSIFQNFNSQDREKAYLALQKVDMLPFKDRQIGGLSGGQQQRVFIARALCEESEILMFDEPFVGVDAKSEEKIIQLIKSLVKEKKTVLIIHHDLGKVKDYFDSVIMINRRLVAYGSVETVFTEKNISDTYGGRPSVLDEADKLLKG